MKKFPDELDTAKECIKAVEENLWAFYSVPDHFKTPELCEMAVKTFGILLEDVPSELKTIKLCDIAVKNNGWSLQYVPDELKGKEICTHAVDAHGWALNFVPECMRTPEICYIAVNKDKGAMRFVPKNILKGDFYTDINDVKSLKIYIMFTPKRKQKKEYIRIFFKKATLNDIDSVASYISLKAISQESYTFLTHSTSLRLSNHGKKMLRKRWSIYFYE